MSFEYSIFIQKAKERFDNLLNSKTFWIHFDHDDEIHHFRIPTIENLSYVLVLLHSHSKECVQNAFDRLTRLLKFYVKDVGFPEALHDFPEVKSFHDQILILAILKKIEEMYGKYLKEDLHDHLTQVIGNLTSILGAKITNASQKIKFDGLLKINTNSFNLNNRDYGEYSMFYGPSEDSFSQFDYWTNTIQRNFGIEKRNGIFEEMGPFHVISLFVRGRLDLSSLPASLLRYVPLLDPKWLTSHFNFTSNHVATLQQSEHIQLNFPWGYSIYFSSSHLIKFQQKTNGFVLDIEYPADVLDEKESLAETQIFITKAKEFNILAGHEKVTTFQLEEVVKIIDSSSQEIANITFEATGGKFMGTVSFGNRPTQKKKTFEPFDQIIGVRTVVRNPHSHLKIEFNYNPSWSSKK